MQKKSINKCGFCNGEFKSADGCLDGGIMTMKTMLNNLFGGFIETKEDDGMGVHLLDGNLMCFDNSSDEYVDGFVEINYCPFCGKELKNDSND